MCGQNGSWEGRWREEEELGTNGKRPRLPRNAEGASGFAGSRRRGGRQSAPAPAAPFPMGETGLLHGSARSLQKRNALQPVLSHSL